MGTYEDDEIMLDEEAYDVLRVNPEAGFIESFYDYAFCEDYGDII